jgi:hypothetical protein
MSGAAMFTETLRHYCRNSRCGSKLKAPGENLREAFWDAIALINDHTRRREEAKKEEKGGCQVTSP